MLHQAIDARASKGSHVIPWGVAIGAGTLLAYYVDPYKVGSSKQPWTNREKRPRDRDLNSI
jgi:hypothetical protein